MKHFGGQRLKTTAGLDRDASAQQSDLLSGTRMFPGMMEGRREGGTGGIRLLEKVLRRGKEGSK